MTRPLSPLRGMQDGYPDETITTTLVLWGKTKGKAPVGCDPGPFSMPCVPRWTVAVSVALVTGFRLAVQGSPGFAIFSQL